MKAFRCLSAAILSAAAIGTCFGASLSKGKCPHSPKDFSYRNITTQIINNYNSSGQTACFSRNLNSRNVHVVYDIYPAGNDANNPTHATAELTLHVSEDQLFFSDMDGDPHQIQCNLVSSCFQ
jgi:hypothetical protein